MTQHKYQLLCCLVIAVYYGSANLVNCPGFAPPKNGHMICDHLLGKYCTPSCNVGYQPASVPAWAYVCNPVTHRWATYPESYPLPWPDCIPKNKISSREHFILHNVFNPNNVTSRRQLSEILFSKSRNTVIAHRKDTSAGERRTPKELVNNHKDKTYIKTTTTTPQPPKPSDLKSVTSKLLKNSPDTLSYVVAEEHENNRTMKNEIDVTNVTRSNINGNNEVDVENITITTTRNNVPKSNFNLKFENNQLFKKMKPLAQTVNAFKKQYVEYMKQNPNGFNTSNFTQFLNEEVNNATRLGEEAFNQSVVQVWGEYYKNFYQTYAEDTIGRQKRITTPPTDSTTTPTSTTTSTTTISTTTPTPYIETTLSTTNIIPSSSTASIDSNENTSHQKGTPKPLGVVVVLVENSNKSDNQKSATQNFQNSNEKNDDVKTTANLLPKKNVDQKGDGGNNSTIINININNININITDAADATAFPGKHSGGVENLKEGSYGKNNDIGNSEPPPRSKKRKPKSKPKDESDEDDDDNETSKTTTTEKSTSTSTEPTTSTTTSKTTSKTSNDPESNSFTISDEDLTPENIKRFSKMIEEAIAESRNKEMKKGKNAFVRTYVKNADHLKEVPDVTANFILKKDGDPPLVPVFSEKDLELLRHMVDQPIPNSNSKRSELKHSISSLWTKMLRLSSTRDGHPFRIPQLGTRKELAKKDSSLAHLIMTDVNGNSRYHFQRTKNPFLVGQFNMAAKGRKYIESNPYTRQYVWNGATYVPATGINGPISYLNSNAGGGLSNKAKYRWNGATYVPNEEYTGDTPSSPSVYPTPENTQDTRKSIFDPKSDSKPFADTNTESQNKLSSWNEPPDEVVNRNNAPDKTASFRVTDAQTQNLSNNPADWPDSMKYFFWDGTQYLQITQSTSINLAPNEIIYKLGPSGMQPINFNATSQTGDEKITEMFIGQHVGENTPITPPPSAQIAPFPPYWNGEKYVFLNDSKTEDTLQQREEDILQSNYPKKPPYSNDVKDMNDKIVAGDPLLGKTPAPPNENIPNMFQASINFPTSSNDKMENTTTTTTPTATTSSPSTVTIGTTTTTTSTLDPYAYLRFTTQSSTTSTTSPSQTTSTSTLTTISSSPTPSTTAAATTTESTTSTTLATTTPIESSTVVMPPPNPFSYTPAPQLPENQANAAQKASSGTNTNPLGSNPYKSDEENINNVIENDLNLKETLFTLSKYMNSSDDTPVTYPITHEKTVTDLKLLPTGYYRPFQPTRNPNIEHEIINDLNNDKPPEESAAANDIKMADELLQKEKNGQQFSVPTAEVKSGEYTANTNELKQVIDSNQPPSNDVKPADLAKALEKSIADTQVSYTKPETANSQVISETATQSSPTPSNTTVAPPTANSTDDSSFLTSLNSNAKNMLEQTLQSDITKLETGKIGDERDADLLTLATSTTESPSDKDDDEPLTMADIRALLQLTKLAEKESLFKKHGLPYPRLTKERALKLLRKPSIKRLVKLLVHKRLSPKVLNLLKQHKMIELKQQLLGQLSKKMIDKKRNEALKRLVTIWNKKYQYFRARNNTLYGGATNDVKVNPLPKFAG